MRRVPGSRTRARQAPGQNRPQRTGPQGRRLQTVTAMLLTDDEFPGELGESFAAACAAVGVKPVARGYGLVLAQDEDGGRWTQVTSDARGIGTVQSIWNTGVECGYEPPDGSVVTVQPGWPVVCELGLAGLSEPHDPAGAGDKVLRPPRRGTPARRRSMADIIDRELSDRPDLSMQEYIEAERWHAANMGDTDPSPPAARLIDTRGRIPPGHPAHQAVDRALAGAWSLAAATKPPPGSVRVRTVPPDKARLVRANGDGWTLIGRTGGLILLLTDALPGIPLDVSDAARLRGLLAALTAAAERAAR